MSFLTIGNTGVYTEDISYVVFTEPWVICNGMDKLNVIEFDVNVLQHSLVLDYLQTLSSHPLLKLWKPFVRVKEMMFRRSSFDYLKGNVLQVNGDKFELPSRSLEQVVNQLELSSEMMNLAEMLRPKMSAEMFFYVTKGF